MNAGELERIERIEVDSPHVVPDYSEILAPVLSLVVDGTTPRGVLMLWGKSDGPRGPLLQPMGVFRTDDDGFHRIVAAFGAGGRSLVGCATAIDWFKRKAEIGP